MQWLCSELHFWLWYQVVRCCVGQVNYMNTRIQFKSDDEEEVAKRFNPLRLLGL